MNSIQPRQAKGVAASHQGADRTAERSSRSGAHCMAVGKAVQRAEAAWLRLIGKAKATSTLPALARIDRS
jgi:hypothetical protein